MEIKSPKEHKNTTDYPNWFDRNKFKKVLAIIDSIKFNYKSKIGEFKYIDIKDLVNNIRNNTISEISAKEGLNTLSEVKNTEIIKYKNCTPTQKELLNLFNDLLDTILTDKTLMSSNDNGNENRNEKGNENGNEKGNEDENENDKTMSLKEDDNETMNQNNNDIIKELNDSLNKIIDKSKPFEEQIKSIKKVKDLNEYYYISEWLCGPTKRSV